MIRSITRKMEKWKKKIKRKKFHFTEYLKFQYSLYFDKLIKSQTVDTYTIPVIIINYNQLYFLKQNIENLKLNGFKNIVVIDNASSYPKLFDYYKEIEQEVTIEYETENQGHMVLFNNKRLFNKYCKGFYILTDADVITNPLMPKNGLKLMLDELIELSFKITKVGLALRLDNIPDKYPLKEKVLKWEQQFWEKGYKKLGYIAGIDTTFALYRPNYNVTEYFNFYAGIRFAGDFTAQHGGWYIAPDELQEERSYYFKNNISTSWIFDEKGNIEDNERTQNY